MIFGITGNSTNRRMMVCQSRNYLNANQGILDKAYLYRSFRAGILIGMFLFQVTSSLQGGGESRKIPPSGAEKPTEKPASENFQLEVTQGSVLRISLSAERARVSSVAGRLAADTGIPVKLGSALQEDRITVNVSNLSLEPALERLAPRALILYETGGASTPRPLAIYLLAPSDPEPAWNHLLGSKSDAMILEGNTEDPAGTSAFSSAEDPLQVRFHGRRITIRAQNQPLAAVMAVVASAIGVPTDIDFESTETLDANLADIPLEEAIGRLSPNARLYILADVRRATRTPLLLRLLAPKAR
jgi:hypothetical protein